MTNAQIIFFESMDLMEQGKIKGSGIFGEYENEAGETIKIELPEEIHTYAAWKAAGRQVQKGEKAVASFRIWRPTTKKV